MAAKQVVVIESGFGGLAVAIRRAAAGDQVTVVEARGQPGGRAYTYRQDGFSFDGGPTVITAPWLITELFELAGKDPDDYLEIVPINPFYRIFFHSADGDCADTDHFDYSVDTAAMVSQIRAMSGHTDDAGGYLDFLEQSEKIVAKGFTELADVPFLKLTDMLKIAPDLIKLQSFRTVHGYVARFVKDERLRQVLSFHPLLVGGNPFQTTSIYALNHYLEREWGVHFAMGGTAAVVDAMVRLLQELGGAFRCDAPVAEITTSGGLATGVRIRDGTILPANVVVSNADMANTYRTCCRRSAAAG